MSIVEFVVTGGCFCRNLIDIVVGLFSDKSIGPRCGPSTSMHRQIDTFTRQFLVGLSKLEVNEVKSVIVL